MPGLVDGLKGFLEAAEELAWPTRCVGCGMPGELLCEDCRASLPWVTQRWACPNCGAPFGWLTCTACDEAWEPSATVCAMRFDRTSSRLVSYLKDQSELRLAPVNAAAMATALDEASDWPTPLGEPRFDADDVDGICFVPATAEAYARRGFDHMELVTNELSRFTGIPVIDVLVREKGADQRVLGREERAVNLAGSVHVTDDVSGLHLLLADDVITTGASIRSCTNALFERGVRKVTCCALARVC